ncbi:hypothetical protein Tco_1345945 [Tanacetum coccineum]
MAESSSQNPSSPNITPKEEPDTQERPESLNPFLPADQVEFTFDEITFSTNNEVALLYPSHPKSEYFKIVSDFISKCCLNEAFTRAPNQYVEYLAEFWYTTKTLEDSKIWVSTPTRGIRGEIGVNTIRNAIRSNYSNEYVASPSITIVRPWFSSIGYNGEIGAKGTLKKSYLPPRFISLLLEYMMPEYDHEDLTMNLTQVFSVHNWALKPNQPEGPPFTDHMKAICNANVPMESQAPKTSSKTEKKVPQGKMHGARSGLKRKQSSKKTSESKTEASKSKTSQSDKETQSSLAKDKSPSHPSASTPVVAEMHKEAQQTAGGPTSLGATRTNPSVLVDKTKYTEDGLKTAHTDLDTRSTFFSPDSLEDEPVIVSDESEEEETERYEDTHATSHDEPEDTSVPHPSSPKSVQLQELMAQVLLLQS